MQGSKQQSATTSPQPLSLQPHLDKFLVALEQRINTGCGSPRIPPAKLVVLEGRRYLKIAVTESRDDAPRYVSAFIDKQNGNVLKPDGWKAPAKHPRGNLFAADGGLGAIGPTGHIVYLA